MAGGYLTTHVLDTAQGLPAPGVVIELFRLEAGLRDRLAESVTNADGRTDQPVLRAGFATGVYELVFHTGAYFDAIGLPAASPRFLSEIPIRFGISDASGHYHVPLLLSPFGYSTYRGS